MQKRRPASGRQNPKPPQGLEFESWVGPSENGGVIAKMILYEGRVQGVGFRFGVRQIAEGFLVAGHAANLADGRVEVFLQGEREEVEAMEKEIAHSHLEGFIRKREGREVAVEAGRKGFQIR